MVEWNPGAFRGDEVFSVVIPTWNNLPYLKLCVGSIRKNSAFPHQIVLHVNDGSDGTVDWAKSQGLAFSHADGNAGVCLAMNAARALVKTDYLLYMNDDMYACPGWDAALKEEIDKTGTKAFFLSATMIEPHPTRSKPVIGGKNYGTTPETFDEAGLLADFAGFEKNDWSGATRPPNVMHRDIWDLVGGYSVEFSPGLYSDPDLSAKLWMAGVREFRGVGRSRVYHFVSKTIGRITPNNGRRQFLEKWGMSPSTFYRYCLDKGAPYSGARTSPAPDPGFRRRLWRDWILKTFGH